MLEIKKDLFYMTRNGSIIQCESVDEEKKISYSHFTGPYDILGMERIRNCSKGILAGRIINSNVYENPLDVIKELPPIKDKVQTGKRYLSRDGFICFIQGPIKGTEGPLYKFTRMTDTRPMQDDNDPTFMPDNMCICHQNGEFVKEGWVDNELDWVAKFDLLYEID